MLAHQMAAFYLLPLFISPVLSFWPTQRGESNAGCDAQSTLSLSSQMNYQTSAVLPNKLPLAPLRSATLIPSPLVCPSGRLFFVGSGGVLYSMDGSTLGQLPYTYTLLGLTADDVSLAYDGQSCTVFVNGVGVLSESLAVLTPIPARTVGMEPVSGVVITFDSSVYFAVRPIVEGPPICQNGGQTQLPGDATILSYFSQYASPRMFFAISASGSLIIASLDLTSCSVTTSSPYSLSQWFTAAIAPYASFVVLYLQEQGLFVLDADKLQPLYEVDLAQSGYTPSMACQPTLALSSPMGGTTTTLVVSTCLTSVSPPATPTPFLLSFSLSASGATLTWATDLSPILPPLSSTPTSPVLNGLAMDKAGNIFASGGPHGDQSLFGGMFSFSGADGTLKGQTQCTPSSTTCGLYGQPAVGLDNTLYAFVMSNKSWEGLVSFSPTAPLPNATLSKTALVVALSVVGGLIALGSLGYLVYRCRGSGGGAGGGGNGGSVYKELGGSSEEKGWGGEGLVQPNTYNAPPPTNFLGSGKQFSFKKEYAQPVDFDRELR